MTPLLPQLSKGFGKKNWLKCCPFFSLAIPFSQALVLFSSSLLFLHPKKLHLSWLTWASLSIILVPMILCLQYVKEDLKKFQSFLCISCMSLYMTCCWARGGRSSYPKSFSRFNQMEKIIWGKKIYFLEFSWPFHLPPPSNFTCKLFTFLDFLFSATI